uniref:Reverse transcriptase Ty1/copia-type domain-containing protein n=1 Tax=Vitis vinifera TaxID=29760 RepID=A5AUI6_VITVI|nr:hypothetical protein VITISV_034971 [Vitis vinifera]
MPSADGRLTEPNPDPHDQNSIDIPRDIHEALQHPNWKAAVHEEIKALEKNGTWELTKLPLGKSTVGCKWIFNVKYKVDGNIDIYKAGLVAKGFMQTYGVDYQETFAPVAKLNTVQVLHSIAVNNDWPLYQLDVKNAFLNGGLNEEVYMDIPPGFKDAEKKNRKVGYNQGQSDHTMFFKHSSDGKIVVLIVYVDDIILTGDDEAKMINLKNTLSQEFEIKDLGALRYFLGMEETGMLGCRPADTPMEQNGKLSDEEESPPVNKGQYQRLVGKLIFLSHTRPNIAFPVSVVSQFMQAPTKEHLSAVHKILRYLKMTPGKGLFFGKSTKRRIEVYSDADWAGSMKDRRSTSSYCTYVWSNLVTWRSKKQFVMARSSA